MGKKREPTIEQSVEYFNKFIDRCKFTGLYYADDVIFGKRRDYSSFIIIVPDKGLLPHVFPEKVELYNNERLKELLQYINEINDNNWIQLDDDKVESGFNIPININGLNYCMEINKKITPCRLLKKEFNNFFYKIKYGNTTFPLFFFKKIFLNDYPDTNFTIMQIYHIL